MNQSKQKPTVSVIVPVYNAAQWLRECLDSIWVQTNTDWECWLIDDGSPDESGSICDQYAAKDERFKVIHQSNKGVSAARNAGLAAAQGQYLLFVDADDVVDARLVAAAVEAQTQDANRLICWAFTTNPAQFEAAASEPLEYACYSGEELDFLALSNGVYSSIWNKLFVAEKVYAQKLYFDEALGWAGAIGEDTDFFKKYKQQCFLQNGFCGAYFSVPLYFYRNENTNSIMSQQFILQKQQQQEVEAPQAGYCQVLLDEYATLRKKSTALFESNTERYSLTRHYLRCLAYGVWSAGELKEALPQNFWQDPSLQEMLHFCRQVKWYLPYYLPFCWRQRWLIRLLYRLDDTQNPNYWRLYWLFFHLLGKGWAIPETR